MSRNWLRRAVLLAACGASLLLAACGSGSIESQLTPARIVAFGDGFADLGQNGVRNTVNDGGVNNWTQKVALDFGLPLAPTSADAQAMSDAVDAAGIVARVGFTFRRAPGIAAVRQQLESGRLGRPLYFSGQYLTDYGCDRQAPDRPRRSDRETSSDVSLAACPSKPRARNCSRDGRPCRRRRCRQRCPRPSGKRCSISG